MGRDDSAFGWRYIAAFTSVLIVNLACALDATTLSVALPFPQTLSVVLGGDAITSFWAGTSFLLTSTIWQPLFVSISQIYGRRTILLYALSLFTIGSVVCGATGDFTLLLTGRCIQGSGVGGILALTEAMITDMVPLRQRGNAIAVLGAVWALGSVGGPLIGGVLAEVNRWWWIFFLNLPFAVVGFIGCLAFLRLHHLKRSLGEKLLEVDFTGAFLFVASLTSFLIPITWGGVSYAWSSWHTLVPLFVGAGGLVGFWVYEARGAIRPMIPTSLFLNRSTAIAYFLTFIHGMILWSMVYYLPLYFMAVHSYTPLLAGVAALPQTLTVVPCAIIVGIIAAKTGRYRWSLWLGWALTTFGCGIMYRLDVDTPVVEWVFLLMTSGIGIGLLFPAMNLAIQASCAVEDVAIAAGLFTFFRALGQTVGVAVGGVIFQNRMQANLSTSPNLANLSGKYSLDAVALITHINTLSSDASETLQLKTAFANSIRVIWAVMCGFAGLGLIVTAGVQGYDLNQALVTEQGFVGREGYVGDDGERGLDMGIGSGKTTTVISSDPNVNAEVEMERAISSSTEDIGFAREVEAPAVAGSTF
ncbi:MFS multidrug transporter protein [Rutstroemia sp. NJR-2017a BBW]|nr:MFS multidrug transporter protein [Rutstroemia sp. NJR-2017a BBW]